jgi:hypothetical protein
MNTLKSDTIHRVHLGRNGAAKIYSEAEVFECPKCFYKDPVPGK